MVITFPSMGNVSVGVKTLCEGLCIPCIVPENTKKTLQIGSFHSPEDICLPFKIILGNILQSIEKGADTVLITGSCGPCRFGEYCEMFMKILHRIGHGNVQVVVIDSPSEIGAQELLQRIGKISGCCSKNRFEKCMALQRAYKMVKLCDEMDAAAYHLAGYETRGGNCRGILNRYKAQLLKSSDPEHALAIVKAARDELNRVDIDHNKDPVRISIIGEIYAIVEPFANIYLEDKLMGLGVCSERILSPSWWVRDLAMKPLKLNSKKINRAAASYLPFGVGGHGRECIGEAVLAKKKNMDGAIQVFPLGCMPEVVARSILPTIQKDLNLPIMTLVVDEVTGEAGYITRVEAFVDMLHSRKKKTCVASNSSHRRKG